MSFKYFVKLSNELQVFRETAQWASSISWNWPMRFKYLIKLSNNIQVFRETVQWVSSILWNCPMNSKYFVKLSNEFQVFRETVQWASSISWNCPNEIRVFRETVQSHWAKKSETKIHNKLGVMIYMFYFPSGLHSLYILGFDILLNLAIHLNFTQNIKEY